MQDNWKSCKCEQWLVWTRKKFKKMCNLQIQYSDVSFKHSIHIISSDIKSVFGTGRKQLNRSTWAMREAVYLVSFRPSPGCDASPNWKHLPTSCCTSEIFHFLFPSDSFLGSDPGNIWMDSNFFYWLCHPDFRIVGMKNYFFLQIKLKISFG